MIRQGTTEHTEYTETHEVSVHGCFDRPTYLLPDRATTAKTLLTQPQCVLCPLWPPLTLYCTVMTLIDWLVILVINGGIVLYGLTRFKKEAKSFDWYLAAKSMPWWAVGMSAFGTAVDSGDYVAIVGGAYDFGLSQLTQW